MWVGLSATSVKSRLNHLIGSVSFYWWLPVSHHPPFIFSGLVSHHPPSANACRVVDGEENYMFLVLILYGYAAFQHSCVCDTEIRGAAICFRGQFACWEFFECRIIRLTLFSVSYVCSLYVNEEKNSINVFFWMDYLRVFRLTLCLWLCGSGEYNVLW